MLLIVSLQGRSEAVLPTFDAVNATLSEIRNAIMETQWAKEIALAIESIDQLKNTYDELLRFHSGLDDYFKSLIGDPLKNLLDLGKNKMSDVFMDFGFITPQIELINESPDPANIRTALETVTGEIPDSAFRPYIPFEEMQVVSGYQYAQAIRKASQQTRTAANDLSNQARSASPKGAARLGVEATSQMLLVEQQNQEALAKLIELQATHVEQVSREEKRYERERVKYMEDVQRGLETLWEVQ